MESQATTWSDASFVGGHPALDFVNTAGGRSRARDVERLIGWGDVLAWCGHTGVLDADEVAQLRARGDADPGAAGRAVADLRDQREALHALLLAGADGTACAPAARERVHADVVAAHRAATPSTGFTTGPAWLVDVAGVGLAVVAVRLALHAAALLADDRRGQLRVCGRCSWLFLDPSPSRRRRWCSMATCGNRAKVQRHHDRRPAGQDAGGDPR